MNQNGYLVVNVSTARGAVPLPNARVRIYAEEPENTGLITTRITDIAGKTERITLDAPDSALSESPGSAKPYASYTVTVDRDGFYPVSAAGVPVFSGVTSVQPIEMLALAEYDAKNVYPRVGLDVDESQSPSL